MTSSIDAKNASARPLLKWLATAVNRTRVTEVLKERVTRIECSGNADQFSLSLRVDGGYGKKILELSHGEIFEALRKGFKEQGDVTLKDFHVLA